MRRSVVLRFISAVAAVAAMLVAVAPGASAQRRVTPVDVPHGINKDKKPVFDRSRVKEMTDANGKIILIDTVAGKEVVDTTIEAQLPKMTYPLFHSASISVNVMDAAMRLLGQHYGLGSVRAALNMHNRYIVFAEVGASMANVTPDGNNYTFHSGVAPYLKLGGAYNVFYNSNPDYVFYAGMAYGITNVGYNYRDITVDEGYWNDPSCFDLPGQRVTAGYLDIMAGIKVKIAGPISLGWQVAFHSRLHESRNTYGPPMIIPGFGKRDSALGMSLYIYYTLPLNRKSLRKVDSSERPEPGLAPRPAVLPPGAAREDLHDSPASGD